MTVSATISATRSPIRSSASSAVASPASYCPATPIFNAADVADSHYINDQIPAGQLAAARIRNLTAALRACPRLIATSWYNSLQVRFQKRASHYLSFEGNYTFSKATDDSCGRPQCLDRQSAIRQSAASRQSQGRAWHQRQRCHASPDRRLHRRSSRRPGSLDRPRDEPHRSTASSAAGRSTASSPCNPASRSPSVNAESATHRWQPASQRHLLPTHHRHQLPRGRPHRPAIPQPGLLCRSRRQHSRQRAAPLPNLRGDGIQQPRHVSSPRNSRSARKPSSRFAPKCLTSLIISASPSPTWVPEMAASGSVNQHHQ